MAGGSRSGRAARVEEGITGCYHHRLARRALSRLGELDLVASCDSESRAYQKSQSPWNGSAATAAAAASATAELTTAGGAPGPGRGWRRALQSLPRPRPRSRPIWEGGAAGAERIAGCSE